MKNQNLQAHQFAFQGLCEVYTHTGVHGAIPTKLPKIKTDRKGSEVLHVYPLDVAIEIATQWVKKQSRFRSGAFCTVRNCESPAKLILLVLSNGRMLSCPE